MAAEFDVAIVGLGAMGAHAAGEMAARGLRVIGIDQFGPLNERGSSHGDSRIIRLAYFEDPCYVPLLQRAYRAWRALEAGSGEELLTITGALEFGRPGSRLVEGVMRSVREHGLEVETMDAPEANRRFPAFRFAPDDIAVLERQGGFLRPERCIMAALKRAGAHGAVLHFGETVLGIDPADGGVTVTTADGQYRAGKVVVAAGSYVGALVPRLKGVARPIRQVVGWFATRDPAATAVGAMPVFIGEDGDDGSFFGFPALGPAGVKIGKHGHFSEEIDPGRPNPPVNDADRAVLADFIARRLPGADAGAMTGAATCRYTLMPEDFFLIDALPDEARIIVASPCSGHGFKFASVIGEILADLVQRGETGLPIAPFSFAALERRLDAGPARWVGNPGNAGSLPR